tara:strand:+ start:2470 stop:3300 length:831 start_codon:yes stop_codon:yes gene_type:complete
MIFLTIPFPNISPEILSFDFFSLGQISIKWYGLSYVLGIFLGWLCVVKLNKNNEATLSKKNFDDLIVWIALGTIIGGRLGYIFIYNPSYFFANPIEIFAIWSGGMSFHGGLLGVTISLIIFAKVRKIYLLELTDIISVATPIGLFFGRIANFINQELWGRVTNVPWAFEFPVAGTLPRHPSQLYEACLEGLFLFAVMLVLWHKTSKNRKKGFLTGIFLIGYACARIFSEIYREPDMHIGFLFSQVTIGQIVSLPLLLLGIILISYSNINTNNKNYK